MLNLIGTSKKESYKVKEFDDLIILKKNNKNATLRYELLGLTKDTDISLQEMESLFDDYYYAQKILLPKSRNLKELCGCHLRPFIKIMGQIVKSPLIQFLVVILGIALPFWISVVEQNAKNKLEKQKNFYNAWENIAKNEGKSGDLGRIEAINTLREDLKNKQITFQDINFNQAAFPDQDLSGIDLTRTKFQKANFKKSELQNTQLDWTDFSSDDKDNRTLLQGADLSNAKGLVTDFRKANLIGAKLIEAELEFAKFHEALLDNANLSKAELVRADLEKASLIGAKLIGTDLSRAKLEGANLKDADFTQAELMYANLRTVKNLKPEQLIDKAKNWRHAIYSDNFRKGEKLCGEVFLIKPITRQISLENYIKDNKDLSCFNFTKKSDLKDKNLTGVNLSRANLVRADLSGANLIKADFTDADLYCTDLRNTNITSEQINKAKNKNFVRYSDPQIIKKCESN